MMAWWLLLSFLLRQAASLPFQNESVGMHSNGTIINDSMAEFLQWFDKMGGRMEGVTISDFGLPLGNGVMATKNIKDKDLVFFVPKEVMITRDSIMRAASTSLEKQIYGDIKSDEDLLALYLMRELHRGSASLYAPYIKVVPHYVPQLLLFTDDELDLLEDPELIHRFRGEYSAKMRQYQSLLPSIHALLKDQPPLSEALGGIPSSFSFQSYLWGLSITASRALTIKGQRFLAPAVDMFNYEPRAEARVMDGGRFYLDYHNLSSAGLSVYADRAFQSGSQVFEDYGDNDDRIYLEHHGFVPENNPHNCAWLTLPAITDAIDPQFWRQKQWLAQTLRLHSGPPLCLRPENLNVESMSPQVIYYGRFSSMSDDGVQACEQAIGSAQDRHAISRACFNADNKIAWDVIRRMLDMAIRERLSYYSTTLAEDQACLKNEGLLNMHERLALQYRARQKKLLLNLREALLAQDNGTCPFEASAAVVAESVPLSFSLSEGKELEEAVQVFNDWMEEHDLEIQKIAAQVIPGMRLGAVATQNLSLEEIYLGIPPELVMDSKSAMRTTGVRQMLSQLSEIHGGRRDVFHELLFHLIHERLVEGKRSSWWPYLALLPDGNDVAAPLTYSSKEVNLLGRLPMARAVRHYQREVKRKNEALRSSPTIQRLVDPILLEWQYYLWAHYILDSRSIWWNNERHLVPMLDLINCQELGKQTRVHGTEWDSRLSLATTKAAATFSKGEQVFENYGQPSSTYFMYHGFVLEENSHDCLSLRVSIVPEDLGFIDQNRMHAALKAAGFQRRSEEFCITPFKPADVQGDRLLGFLAIKYNLNPITDLPRLYQHYTNLLTTRLGDALEARSNCQEENGKVRPHVREAVLAFIDHEIRLARLLVAKVEKATSNSQLSVYGSEGGKISFDVLDSIGAWLETISSFAAASVNSRL